MTFPIAWLAFPLVLGQVSLGPRAALERGSALSAVLDAPGPRG